MLPMDLWRKWISFVCCEVGKLCFMRRKRASIFILRLKGQVSIWWRNGRWKSKRRLMLKSIWYHWWPHVCWSDHSWCNISPSSHYKRVHIWGKILRLRVYPFLPWRSVEVPPTIGIPHIFKSSLPLVSAMIQHRFNKQTSSDFLISLKWNGIYLHK